MIAAPAPASDNPAGCYRERGMSPAATFTCFTHPSLAYAVRFATWRRALWSLILVVVSIAAVFASLGVFLVGWLLWRATLRRKDEAPRLRVGDDGVAIMQGDKHAFLPWARIAEIEAHDQGALVHLEGGRVLQAFCDIGRRPHTEALARELGDRLAKARCAPPDERHVERLRRGRRAVAQWIAELRALDPRAGGYRTSTISERELWELAENPSAPADARAAAAFVLARVTADAPLAAERFGAMARASAQPELASVLDAASAGEGDALDGALARL